VERLWRGRLLSFSDLDRSFTYNIIVSPLPIRNYIARFTCKPVTEGDKTLVEWLADFDVAEADEAQVKERVGRNTFAVGIAALGKKLGAKAGCEDTNRKAAMAACSVRLVAGRRNHLYRTTIQWRRDAT
jgi:hypothetical protein